MYLLILWFRIIFNQKKLRTAALSCYSEPTSCSQRISPYKWNRKLLGFKNKTNPSEREIAGTFRVAKSTVWYIVRKTITHQWAQQHKKAWTSTENVLSNGKEKPFHNIQAREEHSSGVSCVPVQVYNQEKTSQEKRQRVHNKVQTRPN